MIIISFEEYIYKKISSNNTNKKIVLQGFRGNAYSKNNMILLMINFDDYTNENKTKCNTNWLYIPDHPYRILIIDDY